MMTRAVLFIAVSLSIAAPVSAHDIWLTPGSAGGVLIRYGHSHHQEMASVDKLVSLIAYEPTGTIVPLAAKSDRESAPALLAAHEGDALVAAAYDNGYWVRLDDGSYRNASKHMVPQASMGMWSVKFAKAVIGPSAPWDRVIGQRLEIVPLEPPSSASGKIRVRVLFEGRPLASAHVVATDGANLESDADQARASTDADGVAEVPLGAAASQILGVHHLTAPSQTPTLADTDSYSATFTFPVIDPNTN